ncbi:MAG: addiction module protein [Chlorobium sp.]
MHLKDIPQVNTLSIPEKILLVEELWDSIYSSDADVAVPRSHISELENRLARHKSNPGNMLSLDELRKRIESRK